MVKNKRKFILVAAYNRPKSLDKLISSLVKCADFHEYKLVITFHEEVSEIKNYLLRSNLENLITIPVYGKNRSALENINFNRIFGYKYCFEMLEADLVIGLEDDVEVGYDTLKFSEALVEIYSNDPEFKCVNLGSRQPFDEELKFSYGKFRYGIFGQASCIARQQYFKEKSNHLYQWDYGIGLDSMLESYYKAGFVVMPFVSRYINDGRGGTHAPDNPSHEYYKDLESSFVGTENFQIESYIEIKDPFKWREDCVPYIHKHSRYFKIRFIFFKIKVIYLKPLRSLLRNLKKHNSLFKMCYF